MATTNHGPTRDPDRRLDGVTIHTRDQTRQAIHEAVKVAKREIPEADRWHRHGAEHGATGIHPDDMIPVAAARRSGYFREDEHRPHQEETEPAQLLADDLAAQMDRERSNRSDNETEETMNPNETGENGEKSANSSGTGIATDGGRDTERYEQYHGFNSHGIDTTHVARPTMTDAEPNEIETGTEQSTDAEARDVSPDMWAFADDGEFATTWAVERVDETTARVEVHRHEAGLDEVAGPVETFDVDEQTSTEAFARDLADADPEEAVRLAREYYED